MIRDEKTNDTHILATIQNFSPEAVITVFLMFILINLSMLEQVLFAARTCSKVLQLMKLIRVYSLSIHHHHH